MSDSDILVNLVPLEGVRTGRSIANDPAYIVGLIRNILNLKNGGMADCTIEGFKGGLTIYGQREGMSFRWSIHEDGNTYLKAWGIQPTKIWDFLR